MQHFLIITMEKHGKNDLKNNNLILCLEGKRGSSWTLFCTHFLLMVAHLELAADCCWLFLNILVIDHTLNTLFKLYISVTESHSAFYKIQRIMPQYPQFIAHTMAIICNNLKQLKDPLFSKKKSTQPCNC